MMTYYINVGTNLGDRVANMVAAVEAVERELGAVAVRSSAISSPAWGFESENEFLNMAIAVKSDIAPMDMLQLLKKIEGQIGSSVHRDANGAYCDRLIDLDIMAIDEMIVDEPLLQVPHPHLQDRVFYLKPFLQIAPEWKHPLLHRTVAEMLDALLDK